MKKNKPFDLIGIITKHGKKRSKWNIVSAFLIAGVFLTAFLAYLFWGFDILPDHTTPVVGYLDDAILLFIGAYIIRGHLNTIITWFKKIN